MAGLWVLQDDASIRNSTAGAGGVGGASGTPPCGFAVRAGGRGLRGGDLSAAGAPVA